MTTDKRRFNFSSGLATEPLRGYGRAVQIEDRLIISGTTAMTRDGKVVGVGDPYLQTKYVIRNIREVIRAVGFEFRDIVQTRLYITDMTQWKRYARAHREAFERIRPASSIVEVKRLMDPRFMIEMECEAIKGCQLTDSVEILFDEQGDFPETE